MSIYCRIAAAYACGIRYLISATCRCKPSQECIAGSCWCRKGSIRTVISYISTSFWHISAIRIEIQGVCVYAPVCIYGCIRCSHMRSRWYLVAATRCRKPSQECVAGCCWCWKISICTVVSYTPASFRYTTTVCIEIQSVCICGPMRIYGRIRCRH